MRSRISQSSKPFCTWCTAWNLKRLELSNDKPLDNFHGSIVCTGVWSVILSSPKISKLWQGTLWTHVPQRLSRTCTAGVTLNCHSWKWLWLHVFSTATLLSQWVWQVIISWILSAPSHPTFAGWVPVPHQDLCSGSHDFSVTTWPSAARFLSHACLVKNIKIIVSHIVKKTSAMLVKQWYKLP